MQLSSWYSICTIYLNLVKDVCRIWASKSMTSSQSIRIETILSILSIAAILARYFPKMLTYFKRFSTIQELHGNVSHKLEKFVCFLHGAKVKSGNNTQWKEFDPNLHKEPEVTDFASLYLCIQVLFYHPNQTYIWGNSVQPIIEMPEISSHGWLPKGEIFWMNESSLDKIEKRWMTTAKTMQ